MVGASSGVYVIYTARTYLHLPCLLAIFIIYGVEVAHTMLLAPSKRSRLAVSAHCGPCGSVQRTPAAGAFKSCTRFQERWIVSWTI